ncbi:MAG: choice-of-anchor D domain-containing protein, partial [Deltaproteobacteria bacterium]|nr:choice-of-anchor D domain-containing protein [Deltaproteobacteria bacterium]
MRFQKLAASLLYLFMGLIVAAPGALARNGILTDFNTLYSTEATRLDSCGVCHYDFGGRGDRTPYGEDLLTAGIDFKAIEDDDSDGDGTTSIDEILALFMPGYSCDNLNLAVNPPAGLANYADPSNPGCSAAAPDIDVVPLALEFGQVTVAVLATLTFEISNVGTADLNVSDITMGGSLDFDFGSGAPTTPLTLAPGEFVEVPVDYLPSNEGDDAGMVTVHSSDPDEPEVVVSLAGTGVAAATPTPTVSPTATPTASPTAEPTASPTISPTVSPT